MKVGPFLWSFWSPPIPLSLSPTSLSSIFISFSLLLFIGRGPMNVSPKGIDRMLSKLDDELRIRKYSPSTCKTYSAMVEV